MPKSIYEKLPDTVLDYKKKNLIGRFDPSAPEKHEHKVKDMWSAVESQGEISRTLFLSQTRGQHSHSNLDFSIELVHIC